MPTEEVFKVYSIKINFLVLKIHSVSIIISKIYPQRYHLLRCCYLKGASVCLC